jgi:hypothetical protein
MSDGDFDQISEAIYNDSLAAVPYGVVIIQRSYSNTGDDFVFIRYGYINKSGAEIDSGYAGIAID